MGLIRHPLRMPNSLPASKFTPLIASIRGIDGVEIKRLVDRVRRVPHHSHPCCCMLFMMHNVAHDAFLRYRSRFDTATGHSITLDLLARRAS